MKTIKALLLILMVATFAVATERVRFTPTSSSLKITGTSTLHPWTVEGTTINGEINIAPEIAANPSNAASWSSDQPALVSVKIPVTNIKADHDRMTRIMLDALKAKNFPDVQYEMTKATPEAAGDALLFKTEGKLTIAGVTREVTMNVTAKRSDSGYVLTGDAPIKMTDYGITPPVTMLGALKTGNDVTVSFRWVVNQVR